MSFSTWLSSLFCHPPPPYRRRAREERRRRYKRAQGVKTSQPRLDVDISQTAREWSESTKDVVRRHRISTPGPALRSQASAPIKPPPRDYRGGGGGGGGGGGPCSPPSPPRRPAEVTPSVRCIEVHAVKEMIALVGKAFPHIPYAVAGKAAMVHYGFNQRLPKKVTVVCPSVSHNAMRCWAIAQGMHRVKDDPDAFGVRTSDRKIRMVKIKFMDTGFEDLEVVRGGESQTRVVGLPSIADQIARGYVDELATASISKQKTYAEDMRWVLKKMIRRGQRLSYQTANMIMHRDFWLPFTLSFPDTVALFANLGLGAPVDNLYHGCDDVYYMYNAGGPIAMSSRSVRSTTTLRASFSSGESWANASSLASSRTLTPFTTPRSNAPKTS